MAGNGGRNATRATPEHTQARPVSPRPWEALLPPSIKISPPQEDTKGVAPTTKHTPRHTKRTPRRAKQRLFGVKLGTTRQQRALPACLLNTVWHLRTESRLRTRNMIKTIRRSPGNTRS